MSMSILSKKKSLLWFPIFGVFYNMWLGNVLSDYSVETFIVWGSYQVSITYVIITLMSFLV